MLVLIFFLRIRRPRRSPLFPYTTLFRSAPARPPANRRRPPTGPPRAPSSQHQPASRACSSSPAVVRSRSVVDKYLVPHFERDRKSTRLNSSHANISYAVFCLKKKI